MNSDATIQALNNMPGAGFFEMAHVTTFKGYRRRRNGGDEAVTVEIRDFGAAAPARYRYFCIATNERGCTASGNPAESVETTLALVHWFELDREPNK